MKFGDIKKIADTINVSVKINNSVWDKQPILYHTTATVDGTRHAIDVVRCGYLGLVFLLVDNQPTIQLYGSRKTVSQNIFSIGITDADVLNSIFRYAEYDD